MKAVARMRAVWRRPKAPRVAGTAAAAFAPDRDRGPLIQLLEQLDRGGQVTRPELARLLRVAPSMVDSLMHALQEQGCIVPARCPTPPQRAPALDAPPLACRLCPFASPEGSCSLLPVPGTRWHLTDRGRRLVATSRAAPEA